MTLDDLRFIYENAAVIDWELKNSSLRLARIQIEYSLIGTKEAILQYKSILNKEWPMAHQRSSSLERRGKKLYAMGIVIEYQIMENEIEEFIKAIPPRGKTIQLSS